MFGMPETALGRDKIRWLVLVLVHGRCEMRIWNLGYELYCTFLRTEYWIWIQYGYSEVRGMDMDIRSTTVLWE